MKKDRVIGPLYCVTAALIWGLSFVAQKSGAYIGTLPFNGIRLLLGGLVMLPVVFARYLKSGKSISPEKIEKKSNAKTAEGIIVCGLVLFAGSNLQQHAFACGLGAGKVAFITALYMIIVPICGLFTGRRPGLNVWIGVVLGMVGLYFICIKKGTFGMGKGEIFALLCAFMFALHILVIDKYCVLVDNLTLACGQYLVAGIVSFVLMFIFEGKPDPQALKSCIPVIAYAGIGSFAFAFTLQIFGQKKTEPAVASLLLCLESVFAVIFGWIILHDNLGARVLTGCGIMFAGVIISQIDFRAISRKASET